MNQECDIYEFENWALNLGCPAENIPTKKVLARLFASGQALAFTELMRKVKPRQQVKDARDRIIVHKINSVNGKILTNFAKQQLPEQMQRYLKVEKLNQQINETKQRVHDTKEEYHKIAVSVKENNINKIQLKEKLQHLSAKNAITKIKCFETEQQVIKENQITKCIIDVTPVKIEQNNSNDTIASQAITNAIVELQEYYTNYSNGAYDVNFDARVNLWDKLRELFANIPNYILWNNLCKQKEQQVSTIEVMSKINIAKILQINNVDDTDSGFKVAISKLYAKHIGLEIEKRLTTKEKERLLNDYVTFYNSFVIDLRAKFSMYNNSNIDTDFLDEFVRQYSTSYYDQAQIEFLQKAINANEVEIEQRTHTLEDHHLMTNALRCTYSDIEQLYCQMREDMTALSHVKEKIEYNENLLRYLLRTKSNDQQPMATRINQNNSMSSSFDSCNESVLCSTKIDFDISAMTIKSEVINSRSMPSILPQLLNEMKLFMDVPIEKFKGQLSLQNRLEINKNPFVCASELEKLPKSMINLIPNHLQTSNAGLRITQAECNWNIVQRNLLNHIIVNEKLPIVDGQHLNQLKQKQIEELIEISDKATVICSNTKEVLNNVQHYCKFLVENPLRKYIPKNKLFNGLTYQDYEREFMMYYNMIENKTSNS